MTQAPFQETLGEVEISLPDLPESLLAFHARPEEPVGLVLFAHGSGSSRHSSRNQFVAEVLRRAGFASLLLDLLTPREDREDALTAEHRFDIEKLAGRVTDVIEWTRQEPDFSDLPLGLFGASTGAAAALKAAARAPGAVLAVVSRGGRPDLAGNELKKVAAPTLLIVGSLDSVVVDLNEQARRSLSCEQELYLVPGASHLFEETGTLEEAASQAARWFRHNLRSESDSGQ